MGAEDCLFCKIASKQIPSEIVFEDEHVLAFKDIQPQAPIHVLIIPRQHIPSLAEVSDQHIDVLGRLQRTAAHLAKELGISDTGFRTVINCGEDGQQSVLHLHLHLLGGRKMGWPPG